MTLLLCQPASQLGGRGRLAGALQTDQQYDLWPAVRSCQTGTRLAEQCEKLVANDRDDLLRRGQAVQHLEQRKADFAEGALHRLRRQPHLTAQRSEHCFEA